VSRYRSDRTRQGGGAVLAFSLLALLLLALILFVRQQRSSPDEGAADPATTETQDPPVPRSMAITSPDVRSETLQEYHSRPDHRLATIRRTWPDLTEADAIALLEESDRITDALEADGVRNYPLHLRQEWRQVEVSEEESRDYYRRHRESFGTRSFEEVRVDIEELVRLRKLRRQYSPDDEIVSLVDESREQGP